MRAWLAKANNPGAEPHIFMHLPCWSLPRAHRLLAEKGVISDTLVGIGLLSEPIQIANLPTADANKNVALTVEKVKAAGADHGRVQAMRQRVQRVATVVLAHGQERDQPLVLAGPLARARVRPALQR